MTDRSGQFARFLVEEYRAIPTQHRLSVIRDRFPGIPNEEFFRAFEIAEEIAVADAFEMRAA
ncbi:hypothetical protein Amn_24250 [Aminobacter sp. Y103A]|uniref:hypothetical protein n=1 Tax=Aminobacter sp. Y103A TaxID=1870862 RepID=UPI00257341BE|nr:hypothetical protein [Aminobacter sp. SS-2016]BBD37545.1 hypothetical protein Amn_24250 [Aminobacter sp. SS-2016]